jgi:hypothetical protein
MTTFRTGLKAGFCSMSLRASASIAVAFALGVLGCLPADTRPEPGRVYVTTDVPNELRDSRLADGRLAFTTDEGWTVTLDRLMVALGGTSFDGEQCNDYSAARYRRILDMQQTGPQKVGQIYGLNDCLISFSVITPPTSDAVLGLGVTKSDNDLMASALVPTSTAAGMTTVQGMALHVSGSAEKDGTTIGFDWGFSDRIRFTACKRVINGQLEPKLPLVGGQTLDVNIAVDPRGLFRAGPPRSGAAYVTDNGDAGPQLDAATAQDAGIPAVAPIPLMQLMADADQISGNANGHLSMLEMSQVKLPGKPSDLEAIPGATTNLAEALRQSSYPSLFAYGDGGLCSIDTRQGRGRGGGGF